MNAYRKSFIIMLCTLLVLVLILAWQWGTLSDFVSSTHIPGWGVFMTLLIALLFLVGYIRMMVILMSYQEEHDQLEVLVSRFANRSDRPELGLPHKSLVIQRLRAIQTLAQQGADVDQQTLASILAAEQSSRFTLVRYVQNVLILTGVLGTLLSLSVALFGAAGFLDGQALFSKMGSVIGGMSTALITTVVAIVLYMVYSYAHLRLLDLRTWFLTELEQASTLYFIPRLQKVRAQDFEDVAATQMVTLISDLNKAADTIHMLQEKFLQVGDGLQHVVDEMKQGLLQGEGKLDSITQLICKGFRIRMSDEDPQHKSDG